MQIVIDIDDDLYVRLFDNGGNNVMDMRRACVAIRKGILLPKGHGRLIDADDIDNHIIGHVDTKGCPTIIEADKADKEKT